MALFLTKVGNEFADLIEKIYHRGCCYFLWKRRELSHGRDPNAPEDVQDLQNLQSKSSMGNRAKSAWDGPDDKGESLFFLNFIQSF